MLCQGCSSYVREAQPPSGVPHDTLAILMAALSSKSAAFAEEGWPPKLVIASLLEALGGAL